MANELVVRLVGDTKDLERAFGRTGKQTTGLGSKFSTLQKTVAVAAGASGLALMIKGLKSTVGAAQEAQVSQRKLETQLDALNISYQKHAKQIDDTLDAQARLSAFDDEQLADSFTNIVRVVGDVNKALELNALAADIARAQNIDLEAASKLVGKVAGGNVGILSRYGIVIEKGATATEALGVLQQKFAGQAEAYGSSAAGAQDKFRVATENLQEELGEGLLPALTKVLEKGSEFANFMADNPKLAKGLAIAIGVLSAALVTATAVQLAFNLAVLANPYVAAAAAALALAAAMVVLWQKSEFFRKHWQLVLVGLGAFPIVVATIVKAAVRHFDTLIAGFNKVKGVAQQVFGAVAEFIRRLLAPIFAVISAVQTLIGWLNKIPSPGDLLPGGDNSWQFGGTARGAPRMASGGDIARSGLAFVHKGERVLPARAVRGGAGASGGPPEYAVIRAGPDFFRWLEDQQRRRRMKGHLA